MAQTLTTLHNFTILSGISYGSNHDGAGASAALILSGNTLYGTAYHDGNALITDYHEFSPVVVNGQNTMTNPISGIQQFFRLSR